MSDTPANITSPFLPLLLFGCAFLTWTAYQTQQLIGERSALASLELSQEQPLEQSQKLRAALDSIAAQTQRLADSGNASAKLLVDELRKRGITINPNAPTAPPPR
jgi:hypothetical protein